MPMRCDLVWYRLTRKLSSTFLKIKFWLGDKQLYMEDFMWLCVDLMFYMINKDLKGLKLLYLWDNIDCYDVLRAYNILNWSDQEFSVLI